MFLLWKLMVNYRLKLNVSLSFFTLSKSVPVHEEEYLQSGYLTYVGNTLALSKHSFCIVFT